MKYESELIKEIVDSRGHEKSSLHYESECAETWIEEAKGAYPKLCDYESEWLNYISVLDDTGGSEKPEPPIGEFPYLAVTDVTEATVDNVVPYAYKNAILNGQTKIMDELGNECESSNIPKVTMGSYVNPDNGELKASETSFYTAFLKCPSVTFIIKGNNRYKRIGFYDKNKSFISALYPKVSGNSNITIISSKIPENTVYMRMSASISADGVSYTPDTNLLIEDENGNNLYITHLETVKMPVLTTTGKNLNNQSYIRGSIDVNTGSYGNMESRVALDKHIKVKPNTKYSYNLFSPTLNFRGIYLYNINKNFIGVTSPYNKSGIFDSGDAYYINFCAYTTGDIPITQDEIDNTNFMIVEDETIPTSYEPYQTNILTDNEDVTLRGIGDVRDELDLLTGKVTERIGENVLDGSESWTLSSDANDLTIRFAVSLPLSKPTNIICEQFKVEQTYGKEYECIQLTANKTLVVRISKEKATTLEMLKQWLSQNPITVQYELATPTVKTVDLTVVNQDGETMSKIKPIEGTMHLSTSSDTIPPLFSGEIPVEAIAQNLASFIDLETGNNNE